VRDLESSPAGPSPTGKREAKLRGGLHVWITAGSSEALARFAFGHNRSGLGVQSDRSRELFDADNQGRVVRPNSREATPSASSRAVAAHRGT